MRPLRRVLRSIPARRLTKRVVGAQQLPEDPAAPYAAWAELERRGPVPLSGDAVGEGSMRLAFVVPEFRRGSGGHTTIANLVRGLERRGHECSIFLHDPLRRTGGAWDFLAYFGPLASSVYDDLSGWRGADVAIATGWQTVAPVLLLPDCRARAHLVQDEEPDFYPASAERLWAERGHTFGLPCLAAGTWLADRMRSRGLPAAAFELGIDHATYRPLPNLVRAPDRVLFYARTATPRRAVPLGMLALAELVRRRPRTEIVLFGDPAPLAAPFPFTQLGILEPAAVARAYNEAAVGLVLSLTNHSLAAQEMAACGLPTVELRTPSAEAAFTGSPIELADATPPALAEALERLLDDPAERARRSQAGPIWAASRTWDAAAQAVEAGLRDAVAAP